MSRIGAAAILGMSTPGILLALSAVSASSASFDCRKPVSSVEQLICETKSLSRMDDELAEIYDDGASQESERLAVRAAQLAWIARRDRCTDATCIAQSYELRLAELACDKKRGMAGSAIATSQCASAQLRLTERELALVEERRARQVIENSNNPAYTEQVLGEEQAAWVVYRQARCQLSGETEGGSDGWKSAWAGLCEVDATKERVNRLRKEVKGL